MPLDVGIPEPIESSLAQSQDRRLILHPTMTLQESDSQDDGLELRSRAVIEIDASTVVVADSQPAQTPCSERTMSLEDTSPRRLERKVACGVQYCDSMFSDSHEDSDSEFEPPVDDPDDPSEDDFAPTSRIASTFAISRAKEVERILHFSRKPLRRYPPTRATVQDGRQKQTEGRSNPSKKSVTDEELATNLIKMIRRHISVPKSEQGLSDGNISLTAISAPDDERTEEGVGHPEISAPNRPSEKWLYSP